LSTLFATQAILPSLARHYQVTPGDGFAVNASTMGMAIAGLVIGFLSPLIDRRLGILVSLTLLAAPNEPARLGPDLTIFTFLRVMQGLCMASAFGSTLAYLGEQCSSADAAVRSPPTSPQCREQPDRPAGFSRGRDHAGPRVELLFLRDAEPCRRGAGVFHHPARQADAAMGAPPSPLSR